MYLSRKKEVMGMNWTDKLIRKGILEVVEHIGEARMPTAYELREYHGDCRLTGAITRTGGFMTWAKKMELPMKDCDVMLGISYEKYTQELLERNGLNCIHTSTKFPYDLLVDGKVKIDVKVSHLVEIGDGSAYTFKIAKNMPKCDIYVAYCLDENEVGKIAKAYIIPAHVLTNMCQLTIGKDSSKYDIYLDRWELIERFNDSLMRLEETS